MNRTESVDNVNFESHSLFCESCNDEDKCITYIVKNVMTNESFQFSDGNEESIESILQKAKSFKNEDAADILARAACVRSHGSKCPLLRAFFLSLPPLLFSKKELS